MNALNAHATLTLPSGEQVDALAPMIVSASRSTDIPAFHMRWFMDRLDAGYLAWTNPFNRRRSYVSFERARAVVFWTKHAAGLLPHLDALDERGPGYYVQYSVNDYEREGLERNLPALQLRIDTFRRLADRLGPERVIWRYDPILLAPGLDLDEVLGRVERVGDALAPHTRKLVFSFVDVRAYRKVQHSLVRESPLFDRDNVLSAELSAEQRFAAVRRLATLRDRWARVSPGFELATCAESGDYGAWGVAANKCIDGDLLARLFPHDRELMSALGRGQRHNPPTARQASLFGSPALPIQPLNAAPTKDLKDKGQREECGCIQSKDIGAYDTCAHGCSYCYANTSRRVVERNLRDRRRGSESIIG